MSTPPLPGDVASVLVVCPSWVGDTVMATPVLRAIRALRPQVRIIALVRPGLAPLLRGAPFVDETIALDMRGLLGPGRGAWRIRALAPTAALLLPNSFRSALTVGLGSVPIRVGRARDGRRMLLTHPCDAPPSAGEPTSTVDDYAHLGRFALGVADFPLKLEIAVTDDDNDAADRALEGVDGPFALLTPGGNKPRKRWPVERFGQVADALHASHGLRIVASGGPGEKTLIEALANSAATPIHDLAAGGIDLGGLKAVVQRAEVMVTNDTGPRHIAAALGTPVVSLFGPTDHRWTLLPDVVERRLLSEPFLPSELVADRFPKLCTIERIPVTDVISATTRLLDAPAGRARMIQLAPRVAQGLRGDNTFDDVLHLDGTLYRKQGHRRTVRVELDQHAYFVKVHGRTSWREILKNALRLRWPVLTARNERDVIERLHELGVPSPHVVGYGCRGIPPAGLESFLITDALEATEPLDELATRLPDLCPAVRRRLRRALVREVAMIARTLHGSGINHRDFYLCHLLVPVRDWHAWNGRSRLDVHLIDLHRAQRRRSVPTRWIVKDLAGLLFSSLDAGLDDGDFRRFMIEYFGAPWREVLRDRRRLMHRVIRRAIRQYRGQHGTTPRLPAGLASFV